MKKIVINSRLGRFLHGFQETFPHRKRKMLNAYLKFVQQSDFTFFFFCFAKFCELFLSIFNDLKIFLKKLLANMKTTFSSRKYTFVPFQMRYCILYCCILWRKKL